MNTTMNQSAQSSKTLLAKLLATENLSVEYKNVSTASFEVKRRILTLPLFANVSPYISDLLVGHEVGHALHTSEELILKGNDLKIAKSVLNVIEDVRIEKLIKNKYPGLRSSFVKGYRELVEKDFFGTSGVDMNDLNFIDRVNMYHKGGAALNIKFVNDTEKSLLEEINATMSETDVLNVSVKVMDYLKQEKKEKKKQQEQEEKNYPQEKEEDDSYVEDYNEDYDENYDDQPENEEESELKNSDKETDEEIDSDEESDPKEEYGNGFEKDEDDDLVAKTDEEYRKNEEKLFEQTNYNYFYGNIPDIDLKKVIVDYKTLWNRYKSETNELRGRLCRDWSYHTEHFKSVDENTLKAFQTVRNDSNKVVSYLAKEFELRKNADQMKRASVAKTGDLDMKRIFSYQLSEDIFKKVSVVPNGKSHGLVMFLDWSGSMTDHLKNTIKQLINLTLFCKKVCIPFEVYAFTDEYDSPYVHEQKLNDVVMHPFSLLNFLSSKMTATEYTYACSQLISVSESTRFIPKWLCLSGTPLNEAVIAAMKIVPEFQKKYKLQVVNTVFLTDGQGRPIDCIYNERETEDGTILYPGRGDVVYRYNSKLVVTDPVTKHQEIMENYHEKGTGAFIRLLKSRTNCNIVGFYILSGREFSNTITTFYSRTANFDKMKTEFRKNKYQIVTNSGYDEYYLIRAESMDTEEGTDFEVKQNATTRGLVTAFSKFTHNRLTNRVVLNRFIGMIA
jgi:hypothetical protein